MQDQLGVVQKSTGPNGLDAAKATVSSDLLPKTAAEGVQRTDFAAMLAELEVPAATQPLNPSTAAETLKQLNTSAQPPPLVVPVSSAPSGGSTDNPIGELSLADTGNSLPPTGNSLPLPASAEDIQQPAETLNPAESDAQAVSEPLESPPATIPAPVPAAESVVASTLTGNLAAAAPTQTTPNPSSAVQSNAGTGLAPTAPADPGVSSGDQSGEFTFTERQQAELAARLAREQAGDAERQDGTRPDSGRSAALEFSRVESNPLTLPLNAPRPGIVEAPATQNLTLSLPADKANWAEPLAERIAMMIQKGGNTAELRLNPPHLGRLEVQFTVNGDQASIVLTTASAEIRDALQQSLPRLETLLQNSGLQLADSNITDQQSQQAEGSGAEQLFGAAEETGEAEEGRSVVTLGLIDTYA